MFVLAQAFVDAEGDCEERGISAFAVREVHKIALLDMRLGNCDRNGGRLSSLPVFPLLLRPPFLHSCQIGCTWLALAFGFCCGAFRHERRVSYHMIHNRKLVLPHCLLQYDYSKQSGSGIFLL